MSRTGRWVIGFAAVCLSVGPAACAQESLPPSSSETASPSAPPSASLAERGWLAALRVEREPDALDADTRALAGVLGGALVVSPASCLGGLPGDVDPAAYVLGVIAPDPATLDDLVGRTDLEPLFRGEVLLVCTD